MQTLATTLAHISATSHASKPPEKFAPIFTESMYYIEWVAPYVEPEMGSELVDMQLMLTFWRKLWAEALNNRTLRTLLYLQTKKWSEQVLDFSGLLNEPNNQPA